MAAALETKGARLALGALAALGIGLSGFWLARAAVIFITPESEWVAPLPALAPAASGRSPARTLDASTDIFHRGLPSAPAPAIGEDAPETTLKLTVTGLRAGPNPGATIRTPDRVERAFHISDEIVPGATLEGVSPDYIVIRRNGQLERLTIERDSTIQRQDASRPVPGDLATTQERSPNRNLSGPRPGDLLRSISLTQAYEDGRMVGYRIGAGSNASGSTLDGLGLREGDIVTRIAGRPVTSTLDIASLSQTLDKLPSATVMIERDGAPMIIKIGSRSRQ